MNTLYFDRHDAGRRLAAALSSLDLAPDPVVLALPRGGVPVGYEVARLIGAPLDVLAVRKLGVPGRAELAFGAIASGGVRVLNDDVIGALSLDRETVDAVTAREAGELWRRERELRGALGPIALGGRTLVLVDDGLATGATMMAAVQSLRERGARRVVAAAPVGAEESCAAVSSVADEVVCPARPSPFGAVGRWYDDFTQVSDGEVRALLRRAREARIEASLDPRFERSLSQRGFTHR